MTACTISPSFLPIDKPIGARSSNCVDRARRALGRGVKVGHGGTLDSSASGLLVLLVGGATRLSSAVMSMGKRYRARVKLGSETTTCDATGDIIDQKDPSSISDRDIDRCLSAFLGWSDQRPPEISAIHVGGRRAHELYRGGEEVAITPRPVFVSRITRATDIGPDHEFELLIDCGKGTYVRSLARDIGRALGCGAHITALRREIVGPFSLEMAMTVGPDLEFDPQKVRDMLQPIDVLASSIPTFIASPEISRRISCGSHVKISELSARSLSRASVGCVVAVSSDALLSLGHVVRSNGASIFVPETNIAKDILR